MVANVPSLAVWAGEMLLGGSSEWVRAMPSQLKRSVSSPLDASGTNMGKDGQL